MRLERVCLAALSLVIASAALAATIVPPRDLGEMALQSDAVVLARAGGGRAIDRGALLLTATTFTVERSVVGPLRPGGRFETESPGGQKEVLVEGQKEDLVGVQKEELVFEVPGSPRFTEGTRYLLFLRSRNDGIWQPLVLSYGLLREIQGTDGRALLGPLPEAGGIDAIPRPDGEHAEPVGIYDEPRLLDLLERVAKREAAWDGPSALASQQVVPGSVSSSSSPSSSSSLAPPSQCAFLSSNGQNFRWQTFDTGGSATITALNTGDSSLPAGGFQQVQEALGNWMAISGTRTRLIYGGPQAYSLPCTGSQDNPPLGTSIIVFNDPCSDIPDLSGCSGTLAFGGAWASGNHTFDGAAWYTIVSWYVVVNNGSGCLGATNYRRMLTHELGHGQGYGHVSDPNACMYAFCCNDINATDTLCAQYLYPCTAPSPTITGSSSGCGSVPLSTQSFSAYQWYRSGVMVLGATSQTYAATQSGTYTVGVRSASGCNGTSPGLTVTVSSIPASPDGSLRLTRSGASAVLDWADCAGAAFYNVKKNSNPRVNPGAFVIIATPAASTYTDSSALSAGNVWWYYVEAVQGSCVSP